jgi:Fe-S-cluster-containing hydrogenase component 2
MAKAVATIIWDKCRPREHEGWRCLAAEACPHKVLEQEAPGEPPFPPTSLCRGCGTCVTACPFGAIKLM